MQVQEFISEVNIRTDHIRIWSKDQSVCLRQEFDSTIALREMSRLNVKALPRVRILSLSDMNQARK